MDRVKADHMGMLATVINALALKEALDGRGVPARVMSAVGMEPIAQPFNRTDALELLDNGPGGGPGGRHRAALFHHRHGGRAAGRGDQGPGS